MINNQFRKYYTDLKGKGLSLSEKAYMTAIYDRLESSKQRETFFDKEENDYYVIYTIDEMANELEIGTTTVKRTMKSLINKGCIKIKKVHRNVNCIFVCDNFKVCKSNSQNSKKTTLDQSIGSKWSTNYTNKHNKNKLDTNKSQSPIDFELHLSNKFELTKHSVELNGLDYTLTHKLCLPTSAVQALFDVSNFKLKQIKSNLAIILKAKRIAVSKAKKELYFEKSAEIQETITNRIRYIFIRSSSIAKKPKQYVLQAFINYFYEILCPQKIVKPLTYIHKSGYQEKLPSWVKDLNSIDHEKKQLDSQTADIKVLIEKINTKTKKSQLKTATF